MATDYGLDVSTFVGGDLDPAFRWISGRRLIAERVLRRWLTTSGLLEYAPDDGLDVREYLSGAVDASALARLGGRLATEAQRDDGVLSATVSVIVDGERIRVTGVLEDAEGPFDLVVAISALTVDLLSPGVST